MTPTATLQANELFAWLTEILPWEHALTQIPELEGERRRSGHDPHLHHGWELKIVPGAAETRRCHWELIAPGCVHEGTQCTFSMLVTPLTVGWNFEGTYSRRFELRDREAQWNLLPELLTAASRIAGREEAAELQSLLARTILSVMRLLVQHAVAAAACTEKPNLYEVALHYLHHNYYRKELEVGDVARFVGVSPQYLNRVFREHGQSGLRQTLIEIRLKRAAELLREHTYLVGDVASLTGWSSPFYFCNRFKQFYGCAPNQLLRTDGGEQ